MVVEIPTKIVLDYDKPSYSYCDLEVGTTLYLFGRASDEYLQFSTHKSLIYVMF